MQAAVVGGGLLGLEAAKALYDLDTGDLDEQLSNYDANWVWFGMALHLDELPNLNVSEE